MTKTKTDPLARDRSITGDEVVRFRLWADDPDFPLKEGYVGVDPTCAVPLVDASGFCSYHHARLYREDGKWYLQNLSRNGTWIGKLRIDEPFAIRPGMEIRFGGITLIAESGRSIALRDLLMRMLGFKSDRRKAVDLALRRLALAATHRLPIVLCSESDPVALAYSIHRIVFGPQQPFVVCNPRRKETNETVRWAKNVSCATDALVAAAGGSLCVVAGRLPDGFDHVLERIDDPATRVQLVVCSPKVINGKPYRTQPIIVPPLRSRPSDELGLIVDGYALDALVELGGIREYHYKPVDRDWVIAEESKSLSTIQTATERLVALRMTGSISRAAALLGMAANSLKRWIGRRTLPMRIEPPD